MPTTIEIITRMQDAVGVSSNRQLAIYLKIGAQAVSNWISTNRIPYKECMKIALEKNISIEYLLTGKDEGKDIVYNVSVLFDKEIKSGNYEELTTHQFASTLKTLYMAEMTTADVVDEQFVRNYLQIYKKV